MHDVALRRRWAEILDDDSAHPRRQGVDGLLDRRFDSGEDCARWLREVKNTHSPAEARELQQKALQSKAFLRHIHRPALLSELIPDTAACAALLSRPLPGSALPAARRLLAAWTSRLLPQLQSRLQARTGNAKAGRMDINTTIRRQLHRYDPATRCLMVTRLYRKPRREALPPFGYIVLDRSGSMNEAALFTALLACALYALPGVSSRLFVFAEELRELTAPGLDPVECLLALPTSGGTDAARALEDVQIRMDAPAQSAVYLLSDLHSEPAPLIEQAARLMQSGAALYLMHPSASRYIDGATAERLRGMGAMVLDKDVCLFQGL